MRTSASAVYLDSSGLVKLTEREAESDALQRYLASRPWQVSCWLARVEVIRAARRHGPVAVARARQVFGNLILIRLEPGLLEDAAALDPLALRSLDAIHLAAARTLGRDLAALVTYDQRMAAAARDQGLTVDAPGRSP